MIRVPVSMFPEDFLAHGASISFWRLIKLATEVNTVAGDLPLLGISFVPDVLVVFPSLPASTFSIGKYLICAKKLLVDIGRGFC
jgi:hypothetical protein